VLVRSFSNRSVSSVEAKEGPVHYFLKVLLIGNPATVLELSFQVSSILLYATTDDCSVLFIQKRKRKELRKQRAALGEEGRASQEGQG
jgi:hypothetical protein